MPRFPHIRFVLVCLSLSFFSLSCGGIQQQEKDRQGIRVNYDLVDVLTNEEKTILARWSEYLSTQDTLHYYNSPLWSSRQKQLQNYPDFEMRALCYRSKKFTTFTPSILSLQKKDSIYVIKNIFSSVRNGCDVLAIFNVVAAIEKGEYVFHNHFEFSGIQWQRRQVGTITFFNDDRRVFDQISALRSDSANRKLAMFFETGVISPSYYVFRTTEERLRAKGYDYDPLMFETIQESGESDILNNAIYASNNSEFMPHELVHLYIYERYQGSVHQFFDEGLATLLGGNLQRFDHDRLALKTYLDENPDFDFSDLPTVKKSIGRTNVKYILGALVSRAILREGGLPKFDSVVRETRTNEALFQSLSDKLGLTKSGMRDFIKNEVSKAQ